MLAALIQPTLHLAWSLPSALDRKARLAGKACTSWQASFANLCSSSQCADLPETGPSRSQAVAMPAHDARLQLQGVLYGPVLSSIAAQLSLRQLLVRLQSFSLFSETTCRE